MSQGTRWNCSDSGLAFRPRYREAGVYGDDGGDELRVRCQHEETRAVPVTGSRALVHRPLRPVARRGERATFVSIRPIVRCGPSEWKSGSSK